MFKINSKLNVKMYAYAKASQKQRRKCEFILLDSFPQQAIKTGSDGPHVLGKV